MYQIILQVILLFFGKIPTCISSFTYSIKFLFCICTNSRKREKVNKTMPAKVCNFGQLTFKHQSFKIKMNNFTTGVYLLLSGIFISLSTIVAVSTLSYPTSTVLVTFGTIDLMAMFSFLSALIVEKSLKMCCISLFFNSISTCLSGLFFISTLLMDYSTMTAFLDNFGVQTNDVSPEILRLSLFMAGVFLFSKALSMLIGSILLHRKTKKLGEVIMWSYNDQGLYV